MNRQLNAPLLRRGSERRPTSPVPDLVAEHAALARWLGQLQRRVGALQHDHRQQVATLQADLMRLRGQTLVVRTATLWGLGGLLLAPAGSAARPPVLRAVHPEWREASSVICQTGCVGHAHPWRDDQGLCRRTGEARQPGAGAQAEAEGEYRRQEIQPDQDRQWFVGEHSPHSPFPPLPRRSEVVPWSVLTDVIKRIENRRAVQIYKTAVQALDKKQVRIQGCMMPLGLGEMQRHFLLTLVP